MKLFRHGAPGRERPGLVAADGTLRDLSNAMVDLTPDRLTPAALADLAARDPLALPDLGTDVRFGPCVPRPGKMVAIGLNYRDHAAESGAAAPPEPIMFAKLCAPTGPFDPVAIPKGSEKTDWEVELAVVIGSPARHVGEADALGHVAGYCVANDVSERHFQLERGGQWVKGKSADGFAPLGPYLVTADEVGDPQALGLWCDVNGERMQDGTTADMIFGVAFLISYLSRFMSLSPGDVVLTGTPAGVGMGQRPSPRYLRPGDVVRLGIERLGEQEQRFVAYDEA